MAVRPRIAALCLLVASPGLAWAGGGPSLARGAAPGLDRTYAGEGFTLAYPRAYTPRPFAGGVALVAPGRGDVLTASVLSRPAGARALSPEAYAWQFAPLNIQGAGSLLSFARLTLPGGRLAWVGTWRGERGTPVGPLCAAGLRRPEWADAGGPLPPGIRLCWTLWPAASGPRVEGGAARQPRPAAETGQR